MNTPPDKKENQEQKDYEKTVAISREDMGITEEDDYEKTVALSREDMGVAPDDEEHEKTIALTPEEMGLGATTEDEDHEKTVALTREEMGIPTAQDEDAHEATVALTREEMGVGGTGENDEFEKTVALTREEMGIQGDAQAKLEDTENDYEETVALMPEDQGTSPASAPLPFDDIVSDSMKQLVKEKESKSGKYRKETTDQITGLEKKYFKEMVTPDTSAEKFELEKRIVAGGMGAINKVFDRHLQRTSAMKIVLPKFRQNNEALQDFIREAKITGALEHPNIIPVHEIGLSARSGIYFTMKLAHGEDLRSIIGKISKGDEAFIRKFNTYRLLNIFRKVCDAVSFAHSKGVIHRDIKPHNVMVGPYGEVLLMDWGIAACIESGKEDPETGQKDFLKTDSARLEKKENLIKGSPAFMSPEQVKGKLCFQSDIFLLGATLYHIFTLEPPYTGPNIRAILKKAKKYQLIPPGERNPGAQIPEEICRIIMKAMARKPEDRYSTVDEMARDIDDLIAGKWSQQEKKLFRPGEFLMREGETGDEAYMILRGSVQVVREADGRRIVLGELAHGDIVGEMSLITEEERTASVEAMEETEAAVLTKQLLSQNLKKLPPYMEKIVSALTGRLQTANANIHPYATTDTTWLVLKQLRLLMMDKGTTGEFTASYPVEDIIGEISEDLGISMDKVETGIVKAVNEGKLTISDNRVSIPDNEQLLRYIEEKKDKTKH